MRARDANGNAEREMTIHQRNLVDTCFEEGQYESGISVLDQLRAQKYKPFPPHIRQLIYIALYPPPPLVDDNELEMAQLEPGSPSKLLFRQHKSSLSPSPQATSAAQNLLMAFARTNSPEALFRALPCYSTPGSACAAGGDDEDSYIARQALRIRNAKCFWDVLKEGFVLRTNDAAPTARPTGRGRRRVIIEDEVLPTYSDGEPSAVSEYAWSILDWGLTLMEIDEERTEMEGQPLHSPLLLSQIPPPRTAAGTRWDIAAPLDVVFYALQQQSDLRRRRMAVRLLALLINLTSTTLIDFPMFLSAITTRVSSLSLCDLTFLFTALPASKTIMQFNSRPKPQPRAQPRPVAGRRNQNREGSEHQLHSGPVKVSGAIGCAEDYPPHIFRSFDLVTRPNGSDTSSSLKALKMKAELVVTYGVLQRQAADPADKDEQWPGLLHDGKLKQALEAMFVLEGATSEDMVFVRQMRDTLLVMISMCVACLADYMECHRDHRLPS
ncbi:hypothetical protein A0H81_11711 [Grifola frondosa]|uniref:Uncharacterized protein n=1 Tax=Grifola frondosa TaxID=5627 RepID=A0A1C7LT98_GRIFR|nr:hypothetical protein A0H81_11711 [Grifola frondosa]